MALQAQRKGSTKAVAELRKQLAGTTALLEQRVPTYEEHNMQLLRQSRVDRGLWGHTLTLQLQLLPSKQNKRSQALLVHIDALADQLLQPRSPSGGLRMWDAVSYKWVKVTGYQGYTSTRGHGEGRLNANELRKLALAQARNTFLFDTPDLL